MYEDFPVSPRWPRRMRMALDQIAAVLRAACMLARERVYDLGLVGTSWMVERNELRHEIRELRIELGLLRARFERLASKRRPRYRAKEWRYILDLMYRRGWPARVAAQRFIVSRRSVDKWVKRFKGAKPLEYFSVPAHNRHGSTLRWLVHEIKALFPEPECGYRTIANQLMKHGIAMSKSTVQRILREKKPKRPPVSTSANSESEKFNTFNILRPKAINYTWHLDLTTVRVLFWSYKVAALLDGYSRKLLVLRVYRKEPTSIEMSTLVRQAVETFGKPRFMVADYGSQFRYEFQALTKGLVGDHAKGRVRTCTFNGKAERFFKTMKRWSRLSPWVITPKRIQSQLEIYRRWYNEERCHQGVNGLPREEAWTKTRRAEPVRILARDPVQPAFAIAREDYQGDEHFSVPRLAMLRAVKQVA